MVFIIKNYFNIFINFKYKINKVIWVKQDKIDNFDK